MTMTQDELNEILRKHLKWVTSSGGERAELRGADLREADLRRASLPRADLRYADLRGADLQLAYLRRADLRGANLQSADLRWADLRGANLHGTNLRSTKIHLVRVGPIASLNAEAWAYAHGDEIRVRFGYYDGPASEFFFAHDGAPYDGAPYCPIIEAACDTVRQKLTDKGYGEE